MSLNYGYRSKHTGSGSGTVGPTGPSGPAGPVGLPGSDGSDGSDGVNGSQGPIGHTGSDGSDGSIGPTGPAGVKGAKGAKGAKGDDGSIGLSSITSDLNMNTNKIIRMAAPTDDTDATSKEYVDYQCQEKLEHDGSVAMSGNLDMATNRIVNLGAPTADTDASNRKYVTDGDNQTLANSDGYTDKEVLKLLDLGGARAMTGNLDMGAKKITNMINPTLADDASTKSYTDDKVNAGFVNGNYYTNGQVATTLDLGGTRAMTGNLDMGTKKITGLGWPTLDTDASTKKYVDDGNILTIQANGTLNMQHQRIINLGMPSGGTRDATTKEYVDNADNKKLSLDGSVAMTGDLKMGDKRITGLGTPTSDTDASTKKYVDDSSGVLEVDGSLDMKTKKIVNLGAPASASDAVTKLYVDTADGEFLKKDGSVSMTSYLRMNQNFINGVKAPQSASDGTNKKYVDDLILRQVDLTGSRAMTGALNMGGFKTVSLGTPTSDSDASTKKYVDDTVVAAQVTTASNLASMGVGKLSLDGSLVMGGNLSMGGFKIIGVNDPTSNGDAVNKRYADSLKTSAGDTSKFVTVDRSGYKVTYAGGTHKTFSFTATGYGAPYNSGYGSGLAITVGDLARVPVIGEVRSMHIEQEPDNTGVATIRFSIPLPNTYWNLKKTQGMIFAVGCKYAPDKIPVVFVEQSYSNITQDVKLLGTVGEYRIYLSRLIYDASLAPLTATISLEYKGSQRMVVDLYPGFVYDGITQANYYSSTLSVNVDYPSYPKFDHHNFIDSTVGDILVAGVKNPDGLLTVDKLLITEKNIDTSPSSWYHTGTGKSFVTDIPFGAVVRGVNTFTYHRMTLPPAKKITLMVMSVDGNTVLDDSMIFELGAKFYVGGGASTTGKLADIKKSDALIRCEGVTHLNRDIVVSLPNLCIGFEMYMRQSNFVGPELNKKITILVRVYND